MKIIDTLKDLQNNVMLCLSMEHTSWRGEVDSKFSLSDIWNLFQEDPLPTNNRSNFCRQMIYCMSAWNYLQKTSDLSLNTDIIRQTHKIMMDGEDILVGEYRKSPAFAGYHIFAPANLTERYMEDAIFRFHEKG